MLNNPNFNQKIEIIFFLGQKFHRIYFIKFPDFKFAKMKPLFGIK